MADTATLSRKFQISIPKLEDRRGSAKGADPEGRRDQSDRY